MKRYIERSFTATRMQRTYLEFELPVAEEGGLA